MSRELIYIIPYNNNIITSNNSHASILYEETYITGEHISL